MSWWKGRKRTKTNKERVSIAMKGPSHWARKYSDIDKKEILEKLRNASKRGSKKFIKNCKERRKNLQIKNKVNIKEELLKRCNYTCKKCGLYDKHILEMDHIIPVIVRSDLNKDISNLQILCPNCHARKTLREVGKYKNLIYKNRIAKND